MFSFPERIAEGDCVIVTGGSIHKMVHVKSGTTLRLGRAGNGNIASLVGVRFGDAVLFDDKTRNFMPTDVHPDLEDLQTASSLMPATDAGEEGAGGGYSTKSTSLENPRDNRNLIDTHGANQALKAADIKQLREERGVDGLLEQLVGNSTTFQTKTVFAQEKYIRNKKKKYAMIFKVERLTPDSLAEFNVPTIRVADPLTSEAVTGNTRHLQLRCDTVALILHHANVHASSRVLLYEKTNGAIQPALLYRMGEEGRVYHLLDRSAQPNTLFAKYMQLPLLKERWKAVSRTPYFLRGEAEGEEQTAGEQKQQQQLLQEGGEVRVSHWMRGSAARAELLASAADSLLILDDDDPASALADLIPFLALSGSIVIYSPYLEQLTSLFSQLRDDAINIRIAETWYRHHQVLENRTHPTVNMSTAGGYLLTAIKVERFSMRKLPSQTATAAERNAATPEPQVGEKRPREDDGSGSPTGT